VKNIDYPPSVNIHSLWFIHGYKTSRREVEMNINELLRLRPVNLKTVKTDNMNINLVESWSRFFESQGMSHEEAEKQARLTVAKDGKGNLLDRLQLAGFTEAEANAFIEGRGGADNLTEAAK
jgi:hypothetical protein